MKPLGDVLEVWPAVLRLNVETMHQCERMLDDVTFVTQADKLKFDVAIVDTVPVGLCFHLIPHRLGIKAIGLSVFMFLVGHRRSHAAVVFR